MSSAASEATTPLLSWAPPPPSHSTEETEQDYRTGARVSYRLGVLSGIIAGTLSILSLRLANEDISRQRLFGLLLSLLAFGVHTLLLLIVSLRLGAYRAHGHHHRHAGFLFTNPVSKIRINLTCATIFSGNILGAGGLWLASYANDSELMGFWPLTVAGAGAIIVGWMSLTLI